MNQLTLGQAASVLEMSVFELAREIKENKIATLSTEGRVWLTVEALETYRAKQHSPSAQELQEAGILPAPEIVRIVAVPNPTPNPILSNTQSAVSNAHIASTTATASPINYLSLYINQYGATKVKEVQFFLRGYFGEDDSKKLLMADGADKLFTQNAEEQNRYGKRLMATMKKIGTKFSGGIPDKYNCNSSPENFLPGKVEGLEKELDKEFAKAELKTSEDAPIQNITEISAKLGLSPELVRGLIQEGHNVYYLDAITRKGFCLQSTRPFIGGQTVSKSNWDNNFRRALVSYGCRYEPKTRAAEEKLLERIGLVIDHRYDGDGPVSFNPKWSFHTRSLPHLQNYLELYLSSAARRGER